MLTTGIETHPESAGVGMNAGPDGPNRDAAMRSGYPMPCREVIVRELEGEAVVYDVAAHEVLYLNETALALWRQSDGTTCVDELIRRCSDGRMEDAAVRGELHQAIEAMVSHAWLTINPGPRS